MKIKEWLNRGRECEGMIEDLEPEKEKPRKRVFLSSCNNYRAEFQMYLDYEAKINEEIDRLIDIKQEIFDLISSMSPGPARRLLQLRYLCMVDTWEHIAEKCTMIYAGYIERYIQMPCRRLKEFLRKNII